MDIFSHALAGAATGAAFGRPFTGAFFGVLPDISVGVKRKPLPNFTYDFTHSIFGVFLFGVGGGFLTGSIVPMLALMSHLILDMPTHGEQWAPPLLFPFDPHRFSYGGEEWEWFNPVWCFGFLLTIVWSAAWFSAALVTGYL